jgi:hypothetical protein
MQAHIFAEGSTTTADSRDQPVKEYYKGLFSIILGLDNDLSEVTETHLHVLSEDYGIAEGDERMSAVYEKEQVPVGKDVMADRAKSTLLSAAAEADIMVILLSTDVFESTVGDVWGELAETAKSESVWCLGAARSSLKGIELGQLESKGCAILTYRRVGVAPLGSDTREELLGIVRQRASQK